jgi:hypothetical protein
VTKIIKKSDKKNALWLIVLLILLGGLLLKEILKNQALVKYIENMK